MNNNMNFIKHRELDIEVYNILLPSILVLHFVTYGYCPYFSPSSLNCEYKNIEIFL